MPRSRASVCFLALGGCVRVKVLYRDAHKTVFWGGHYPEQNRVHYCCVLLYNMIAAKKVTEGLEDTIV